MLYKLLQKNLPDTSTELIMDFIYGDINYCKCKSKEIINNTMSSSLHLAALVAINKLKKTNKIKSIKIVRKEDSKSERRYYHNILIDIKWIDNFSGPRTILLMYRGTDEYNDCVSYETYGFFQEYKPLFITIEQWSYIKDDVVVHNNLKELIIDIYREDINRVLFKKNITAA